MKRLGKMKFPMFDWGVDREFNQDVLNGYGFLALLAIGIVLFLSGTLSVGIIADQKTCNETAYTYGVQPEWGFWTGCLVVTKNGTVTSLDKYLTVRNG